MHIFKHDNSSDRPLFTNKSNLPDKPTESSLTQNPLLNSLKPVKDPSRVAAFFRRTWANVSKYFGIKHPDPIHESLKHLIRPEEGKTTDLTVGNLWHHYERFLKEDSDCPPALKKAFNKMEKDEKDILKHSLLSNIVPDDEDKSPRSIAKEKFIKKTKKSIERMPVGTTRLFLLQRGFSGDQSLSGDLFCTISHTKDGYVLSFMGSGDQMNALQKGLPLAGKEKSARSLTFEPIPEDVFKSDDFLSNLLTDWVKPESVSSKTILESTKNFTKKVPSTLEDYTTSSRRPDKLFWNIVLSIPQENTKDTLKEGSLTTTRSIRLRTELLMLYEAYAEARIDLDPKSKGFKDLNKLLKNVSAKVLIDHKKGRLSDEDFKAITKRLKIMDDTLRKASSEPSNNIPSRISVEKPAFYRVSLKKAEAPQTVANAPVDLNSARPALVSDDVVQLSSHEPISLQTYTKIDTKEEFLEKLTLIHALSQSLENGSPAEQKAASREIFRFFHEVPISLDFIRQFSKDESLETIKTLGEILDNIAKVKKSPEITQYDYESLDKLHTMSLALNAHRTGFWIGYDIDDITSISRNYKRFTQKKLNPKTELAKPFTSIHELTIEKNSKVTKDDYELIMQQKASLQSFLKKNEFHYNSFKHWLRPIHNAFLIGLYESAISDVRGIASKAVPEAFFDNPEETFRHYISQDAELTDIDLPGTPKELKTLSRLLRNEQPQIECLAFIKENATLLYNPEIRNFFDALFFGQSLSDSLQRNRHDLALFPQTLAGEINKFQKDIEGQLSKGKIADPDLLTARMDLMLYYHEMLIRLKASYKEHEIKTNDFPDTETSLENFCSLCRDTPELNSSCGYAYRLLLRAQLENLPIKVEMLGKILNSYVDIKTSYINPNDIEPHFEEQMDLHWELISNQLKNEDVETLTPLLNRLCNRNGITPGDDWTSSGNLVFQNDQVEVDLKNLTVNLKQTSSGFVKLPQEIITDPFIEGILSKINLRTITVLKEEVNGATVYSFNDSNGTPIQIEERNGAYFLYKKLNINGQDTWVLAFDLTPQKIDKPDEGRSLLSLYSLLKEASAQEQIAKGSISFFNNLYIDPNDKYKGVVLDPSGKIAFQVKLKKDGKNLSISKVWDHRELPSSGPWEVHNANLLKDHSLNFLKGIENKDNIVLWARKGKLKKVELPRYGLKFDLEGGKLLCRAPGLEGYYVNPDQHKLSHGLVLEHPSKGKKILLGDADALKSTTKNLSPKGYGPFGGISIALHNLGVVWDLLHGQFPKQVSREISRMNSSQGKLKFTVFDLRPNTGEICQTKNWPYDLLQLIKHELIADHPLTAASHLEDYPIKAVLTDQKLLGELIRFCNSDSSNGAEASIKLKLSLKLLNTLSSNNKLKKNIKTTLLAASIKNGKHVLRSGRRVPKELQLTDNEKMKLLSLIKKKDPSYTIHMAPHFLDSNTSFDPLTLDTSFIDDKITNWKPQDKPVLIEQRIETLEAKLNPVIPLSDTDLSVKIDRLAQPESLLFTPDKVQKYFTTEKKALPSIDLERSPHEKPYETVALDAFQADLNSYKDTESLRDHQILNRGKRRLQKLIDDKLIPKQEHYESEMEELKEKIEKSLRKETDPSNQIALIASVRRAATFEEVRLALVQGKLKDLQDNGMIPAGCDLVELEANLIGYFDALARRNATSAAIALVEKMKGIGKQDTKNWDLMSKDLYRLLTLERKYDPKSDPRLLVFEAQLGLNLKELEGGLNQLDLLESVLSDPNKLVQAPTGAGKSSVISVLEALLKSNGNNLVIQKVLPPLYNQTKDKLDDVLGDLLQTLVMPLRFNLKMRLTKPEVSYEVNDKGVKEEKIKQVSIFKGMYEELLEVMDNQGCVLTDYTSFPMMEAKFLQIGQELVECSINGTEPTALQIEHYTYLRKILVLLRNKGLSSMDEFDQPNRPIQKIQLDLKMGSGDIPPYYIDTTLEIYDILGSNPHLGLDKNIQSDVSKTVREQAVRDSARIMAKRLALQAGKPELENGLTDYLLGLNEDVLEHLNGVPPAVLDKIAFSMKQFAQFIPLTLNAKEGSNYARSTDGSKTVPSQNGQIHDSKHGTLYEQINYTVQSYRQKGIQGYDLKTWFTDFKKDWDIADGSQQTALERELQDLFPNYTVVEVADMLKSEDGTKTLLSEVNLDMNKITKFLTARLQLLKSSGYLISMDPTNVGDMTLASSGISATTGDPDSLHEKSKMDRAAVGQIKASMAYRMWNRALDPSKIHSYDPEQPELTLSNLEKPATVIIDGSGAFNDSTQDAAKNLLSSNGDLKQVGYHQDETIVHEGVSTGSLAETGFVFNQAHTRGTDILLAPNAHAFLPVNEKEGFRGFAQEEGRLRGEGQTYELGMPKDQKADNLLGFMTQAECVDALQDAKDIYRHATQDIRAPVRNQMMGLLLACEDPKDFVTLFRNEDCNALYITKPEKIYTKPGDYFADNRKIQREDIQPENALNELFVKNKKIADNLGLQLEQKDYTPLLAKMPTAVSGVSTEVECELQVEVEQEVEAEVEAELELEQNQELDIDNEDQASASQGIAYPDRIVAFNRPKAPIANINPAYNAKIYVTENFLPYERNKTASKFKREPFQRSMFDIGTVHISVANQGITHAIIDDPLFDMMIDHETKGFVYDIRLGKVIKDNSFGYNYNLQAQRWVDMKLENFLQTPEFLSVIAQVKFLDGRTSGYSEGELAALKQWLIDSGPEAMKNHLLNEVLMFRYREKSQFNNSQLGQLFRDII